jgi:hypothetical protein
MNRRVLVCLTAVLFSLTVIAQQTPTANIPRQLRFGGTVKSADGTPRTGVVGVMFSLYTDQQGGTALWTELQNVQLDANGQYSVLLGSQHAEGVPAEVFTSNEARWLGIQVEAEPEQPRVLLVSVPYALKAGDAETLGGKPLSSFLLNPNPDATGVTTGTATTTQTTSSGVKTNSVNTSSSGGTANYVAKWIDASTLGNSLLYDSGSKVGIGTATPAFTLDVVGGIEAVSSAFPQFNFKQTSGTAQEYRYQIDADGAYRIYDITAGAPRFTMTQAGKVGIGTTTPGFSLDVVGGIEAVSSAFPQINFKQTAGTAQEYRYQIDADGAYRVYDITAGVPRFTLTQAGNVGIGTSTPAAKLEVNGSLLAGGIQAVSGVFPQFNFKQTAGTLQEFRYQIDADGAFRIYDMTAGALPRFTVTQAGNIGIGNSVPGQKLSVAGAIESTSGGFKFPDGSTQASAATGGVTGVNASAGVNGSIGSGLLTLTGDTTYLQKRVTGTCATGSAMAVIGADGSVSCNTVSGGGGSLTLPFSGTGADMPVQGVFKVTDTTNGPVNSQTGGPPDPNTIPAALLGLATGTGITAGVVGKATGPDGVGVVALNTSTVGDEVPTMISWNQATSGKATLFAGLASSPDARGIDLGFAVTPSRGFIQAKVGPDANQTTVFFVDGGGTINTNGGINAVGTIHSNTGFSGPVKTFKIDDPIAPADKWLYHTSIESPDMMNVYNGVIALDARGQAWVQLPEYFEALNKDFRYQLTAIGAPGPNLFIAKEIAGNRFRIAGGKAHGKVSWQVTGIRHDAWANAHRTPVEEQKSAAERGTYLSPELFGHPGGSVGKIDTGVTNASPAPGGENK